jgi:hypothetical protein
VRDRHWPAPRWPLLNGRELRALALGADQVAVLRPRANTLFAGDVDRDGHLDIIVTNSETSTVVVLLGRGDGTFSRSSTMSNLMVVEVAIHDWDGDGIPDLLAMGATLRLLVGIVGGRFAQQQDCGIGVSLRESIVADLNGDGKADMATILHPNQAVSVMLGGGGRQFQARDDYPTQGHPVALAAGDLTGDGIRLLRVRGERSRRRCRRASS